MKKSIKTFLILVIIFFSNINGYAIENLQKTANLLDSIEIKSINNSYEITLETTNAVPMKTNFSDNKMFIDLKGITPSSTVNTIYNNASNIDNILIQPNGKDTRIIIQGTNLNSAQVLLTTSKVPANLLVDNTKKEITLNRSIDSYSPIIKEESTNDFNNMFSLSTIDISELLRPSTMGWLIGLALILMILIKSLKEEKKAKPKKNSEFSPKDIMKQKQELLKKSKEADIKEILSLEKPPEKLNLEKELEKAHNRFNESLARRQDHPKQNASIKNYGIKEYQNSQIDPYQKITKKPNEDFIKGNTTDVLKETETIKKILKPQQQQLSSGLQKPATRTTISAPTKTAISRQDLQKAQKRLQNMRFLDKMSQIYEQNGRKDLAQNIKEKIYKNR